MPEENVVLYLCDQKDPECMGSTMCGTACIHTKKMTHAVNFKCIGIGISDKYKNKGKEYMWAENEFARKTCPNIEGDN